MKPTRSKILQAAAPIDSCVLAREPLFGHALYDIPPEKVMLLSSRISLLIAVCIYPHETLVKTGIYVFPRKAPCNFSFSQTAQHKSNNKLKTAVLVDGMIPCWLSWYVV